MSRNRLRPSLRRIGVRLSGGGSSLDADAATLIAAMTTAPDATRQGHINTLITGLKTDGVWAELDELWVTAAHAEQAGLLGWKRYKDLTAVNAPTFTANQGFAGNGTTSYLNTNFTPSTDGVQYTLNDASLGVYSRTNSTTDAIDMGGNAAGDTLFSSIQSRHTASGGTFFSRVNQGSATAGHVNANSLGLHVSRRVISTTTSTYKNGVEIGTDSRSSTGLTSRSLFLGAGNNNGTAASFSTRQYAAAFVGAAMSEAQQLALFTRLETYLDAIGAGVVS